MNRISIHLNNSYVSKVLEKVVIGKDGHFYKKKNIVIFLLMNNLRSIGATIIKFFGEPSGSTVDAFKHVLNHFTYINCLRHALLMLSEAPSDG